MMGKQKSTMGQLLSTFRFERKMARDKAEKQLWEDNNLSNPTKRQGYEIHESSVHDREGNTVIGLELWKRIDTKVVQISVDVKSQEIKQGTKAAEPVGSLYE